MASPLQRSGMAHNLGNSSSLKWIAASEKLAVMLSMDYLKREAAAGRRKDFENYLSSVPAAPPLTGDDR